MSDKNVKICEKDIDLCFMGEFSTKQDKQVWTDFLAGSEEAFQTIYDTHIQLLFKYGCHFSADEDFIKDCIQDLFLDLLHYRSKLGKTDNIKAYLLASLKRKIFKKSLQKEKSKITLVADLPFDYSLMMNDAEEQAIDEQRVNLLSKALQELSSRQKEAIYLKYVIGLSYEELSQALHLNYQTTRNLIYKSMEKLRTTLKEPKNLLLMILRLS